MAEEEEEILAAEEVKEVEVAADTGAVEHCWGPGDLPKGAIVKPPERERNFVGAQGGGIDHYGSTKIVLETADNRQIGNEVQVMNVCRPLHSISKITDTAHDMLFTRRGAVVVPEGVFDQILAQCEIIAKYPRKGGLWVAKMKVRAPASTMKFPAKQPDADGPAKSSFGRQGVQR